MDVPKYHIFASCRTLERPYSSLRGPSNKGPTAEYVCSDEVKSSRLDCRHAYYDSPYAATKMDVSMAMMLSFVMPNSDAICPVAGAIIEDETGEMKVNADTITVAAHFF